MKNLYFTKQSFNVDFRLKTTLYDYINNLFRYNY